MISPHLAMAVAQAKMDDLRRAADAHRLVPRSSNPVRVVGAEDKAAPRFGSQPLPEPERVQ
jgi:hypothetical protein